MKIVIVAGGTGGHLYPGVALARALKGHDVLFVVRRGDMGRKILEKERFAVEEISGQGLPRSLTLNILSFPFRVMVGGVESWRLLRNARPDWVVGMGGYLSFAVILVARMMGIKTLLHEQNVYPGLTNRLLSRWVDSVAVSFPESAPFFKVMVWVSGLPIRPDIGKANKNEALASFGLPTGVPTLLVFGGSLGAQRLNTMAVEAWPLLQKKNILFQVIHITGSKDFDRVQELYRGVSVNAKVIPYCHDMANAYAASDAVVCRAGASTVAELLAAGRRALLVPYPHASNNHQVYNAKVLQNSGLGQTILDAALSPVAMADYVAQMVGRRSDPLPGLPDPLEAASRLADFLLSKK